MCNVCPCACEVDGSCHITGYKPTFSEWYEDGVKDCPLVEIPPHGRLIDADELRWCYDNSDVADDVITKENYDQLKVAVAVVRQTIDDAPTIIEAEEGCGRCDYCRILQTGTCRYGEENE